MHPVQQPFTDTEVPSVDKDKLGRDVFARRVAERIVRSGVGPSTVFGLSGRWGSGKTSTLNFIRGFIEAEHGEQSNAENKWAVVAFTPWSCTDIEALTDEFYRAIATAMPDDAKGKEAKKLLAKAAPLAAAVGKAAVAALVDKYLGDDGWKKIAAAGAQSMADQAADEAAEIAKAQPTFLQRFDSIAEAIKLAGRNVLVVIDDVDRLHADELLGVMKAVRLLGRFDRVHYLLSYDEATVLDVLEDTDLAHKDRGRARLYLEKIIQYPFALPPIQEPHLEQALSFQLRQVADTYLLPITNSTKDWTAAVDRIVTNTPHLGKLTLRSISRWCHQIDMLLALVGAQELNFTDAALITYLRLWHNDVYLALPSWQSDLTDTYRGNRNNELTVEQWTDRIAATLRRGRDDEDPATVVSLLASLFPRLRQGSNPRPFAISDREYFARYFTLSFPLGDVSDLDVRGELETLATTGMWSSGGLIAGSIADPSRRYSVGAKALRSAEVIDYASAEKAVKAAHEITRLLHSSDLMGTPWGHIVYLLLRHAIQQTDNPASARGVIDDFTAEFGLITAAAAMFYRKPKEKTEADERILAASEGLRDSIFNACIADLTTSDVNDDPSAPKVLNLLWSLDAELWDRLRAKVIDLLQQSHVGLADLAARFVVIQPHAFGEGRGLHEFRSDDFSALIPKSEWVKYQIPPVEDDQVDVTDPSLANRVAYAAARLRAESEPAAEEAE